jgi:hypothetical protein
VTIEVFVLNVAQPAARTRSNHREGQGALNRAEAPRGWTIRQPEGRKEALMVFGSVLDSRLSRHHSDDNAAGFSS